jgi:hypothetical protein
LASNAEVKVGKILKTKVGKRLFGTLNIWEQTLKFEV